MGFDSYIAWPIYCGPDVMNSEDVHWHIVELTGAVGKSERRREVPCSKCSWGHAKDILPKHPTAMTPDELLDFAMRFVEK